MQEPSGHFAKFLREPSSITTAKQLPHMDCFGTQPGKKVLGWQRDFSMNFLMAPAVSGIGPVHSVGFTTSLPSLHLKRPQRISRTHFCMPAGHGHCVAVSFTHRPPIAQRDSVLERHGQSWCEGFCEPSQQV
jgi:hypothetical protein